MLELLQRQHALLDLFDRDALAETLLLLALLGAGVLAYRRAVSTGFACLAAVIGLIGYHFTGSTAIPFAVLLVGLLLALRRPRLEPAPRIAAAAAEFGVLAGGLLLYVVGRMAAQGSAVQAQRNAERLLTIERALRLSFEAPLQRAALRNADLTVVASALYSFWFLATAVAVLLWLYLVDRRSYRLLRASLGVSALLAVALIWAFPTAPPRLAPAAGVVDTVVLVGRDRFFVNEYAAMPSLHVGWMVLAGYVLARSIGGRRGVLVGLVPGTVMGGTVLVTGNHYVLDGAAGSLLCLGPAVVLERARWQRTSSDRVHLPGRQGGQMAGLRTMGQMLLASQKAQISIATVGLLLLYLLLRQPLDPGFTDFWFYLTFQVAVTLLLLVAAEVVLRERGGLSWPTHLLVVATLYGDVLGTDGDLYANIGAYDKLTHFLGIAAVTAAAYEVLWALRGRRGTAGPGSLMLAAALAIGVAAGISWEIYEWVGDHVFHTLRVQSPRDTAVDLISDTLGALTAVLVVQWARASRVRRKPAAIEAPPPRGAASRSSVAGVDGASSRGRAEAAARIAGSEALDLRD